MRLPIRADPLQALARRFLDNPSWRLTTYRFPIVLFFGQEIALRSRFFLPRVDRSDATVTIVDGGEKGDGLCLRRVRQSDDEMGGTLPRMQCLEFLRAGGVDT